MDFSRFYALRRRLFDLIRYVDDGYHKSYEGALDICFSFPCIFESKGTQEPEESVRIELHCYLLCEGRHKEFVGRSFDECLDKFEAWLNWAESYERGKS